MFVMLRYVLIASLTLVACEDELADQTDEAAARVKKTENHLHHERRQLAVEVAERADDRAAHRDGARHDSDIANAVEDVNREAGRLARAQDDYANLRALRVASLRAAHSVAASQPLLIQAIAGVKPLSREMRAQLDESLAIFNERLAQTRRSIEELEYVSAADWDRRDADVGRMIADLGIARDASWQAIDDHPRDERFPGT